MMALIQDVPHVVNARSTPSLGRLTKKIIIIKVKKKADIKKRNLERNLINTFTLGYADKNYQSLLNYMTKKAMSIQAKINFCLIQKHRLTMFKKIMPITTLVMENIL